MPHPLEAGTIRILKSNCSTAGTGFLLSRNLAVTCAHVIDAAGAKPGDIITFEFHLKNKKIQKAIVLDTGWSLEDDVAVLELADEPPKWIRPITMQSSNGMEGRSFQGLGYPVDGPVQTRWPQGNIGGITPVVNFAHPLLQIQGREIDKGLSGSAVVDQSTRRVIGMVTAYQDISRPSTSEKVRFGYAIPIETIWKVYPDLEKELPPILKRSPVLEGIHLLPNGYDFRIQNFLTEYLGTPDQPEPFGGREDQFKELNGWLDGDNQRLMLAAPAGRGKSALLVRWLEQLLSREDLALVFIPISIRFRTNLASTFFASLAARLAYLHGESIPATEISADMWQRIAVNYLGKPLSDQRKLLVILDGLDEAGDWEASENLLPGTLPINTRIVASARLLAGDVDAEKWLYRLGWEHKRKATTIELPPLRADAIEEILLRMGFALDKVEHRRAMVSELHRLSQGDPLLVNLYVEDLLSRGEQASRLKLETLQKINPGYEGYFDRWWHDQKKLWGSNAPLQEKNTRFIFNILCGALGGLTIDDLMALGEGSKLNTYAIEDVIVMLKRFVIAVQNEKIYEKPGYVLTHPKLRDYFWDKLSLVERTGIENNFITWGQNTLHALESKVIQPIDVSSYLLQYFIAHLGRSGAAIEKFLPLVNQPYWYQAWLIYEGSYGGYLRDVSVVSMVCSKALPGHFQDENSPILIATDIRCKLIEASIRNLANSIPPQLIIELVRAGLWTGRQALIHASHTSEIQEQKEILVGLLAILPESYYDDVLQTANKMVNEWARADVLIDLIKRADTKKLPALIENLQRIESDDALYKALTGIVAYLPENYIYEVLLLGKKIEDKSKKNAILKSIIEQLSRDFAEQMLSLIVETESEWDRADLLVKISVHLPEAFIPAALDISTQLKGSYIKAKALGAISRRMAPGRQWDFVSTTLLDAKADGYAFASLIEGFAEYIQPESLDKLLGVLNSATDIENPYMGALLSIAIRSKNTQKSMLLRTALNYQKEKIKKSTSLDTFFLNKLMQQLPDELILEGLELVEMIMRGAKETASWERLLRYLIERAPEFALESLYCVVKGIEKQNLRCELMLKLVDRFQVNIVDAVLSQIQYFDSSWSRARLLMCTGKYIPDGKLLRLVFQDALKEIRSNASNQQGIRTSILIELAQLVPDEQKIPVLQVALESLDSIDPDGFVIFCLEKLIPIIPDHMLPGLLAYIKQGIKSSNKRAIALSMYSQRVPDSEKPALLVEALRISSEIGYEDSLVKTIAALASRLPGEMQNQLLSEVDRLSIPKSISAKTYLLRSERFSYIKEKLKCDILEKLNATDDQDFRARVLLFIANRIDDHFQKEELLDQALLAGREIKDLSKRAEMICSIAKAIPNYYKRRDSCKESIACATQIDRSLKAHTLLLLAEEIPEEFFDEIARETESLPHEDDQTKVLAALARRIHPGSLELIVSACSSIKNQGYKARVLTLIAHSYPENRKREIYQECIENIPQIKHHGIETPIWEELIPLLPEDMLKAAREQVQKIPISDTGYHIRCSIALALREPQKKKEELLPIFLDESRKVTHPVFHAEVLDKLRDLEFSTYGSEKIIILEQLLLVLLADSTWESQKKLIKLAPKLNDLSSEQKKYLWMKCVPRYRLGWRTSFLSDLFILESIIPNLDEVASDIFLAVRDVSIWWP
jgi:hypothetical protein